MSGAQHTPGEWSAREGTTTGQEVVGKKPRGGDYIVARCGGSAREANARLIAASPELLEALRNFTDGVNISYTEALVVARAAIAKARGA